MVFHHQINKMQNFFLRKSLVCRLGISPRETFSARDCHLLGWLLWRQSVTRATCCSGPVEAGGPQGPWLPPPILASTLALFQSRDQITPNTLLSNQLWRQSVTCATCCSASGSGRTRGAMARTYLQLPLWHWGAGNVYLLVLSSSNKLKGKHCWKPHCCNGVVDMFGH